MTTIFLALVLLFSQPEPRYPVYGQPVPPQHCCRYDYKFYIVKTKGVRPPVYGWPILLERCR